MKEYKIEDIKTISRDYAEQETTISFGRTDTTAHMWVADSTMLTKVRNLIAKAPDSYKITNIDYCGDEVTGFEVEFPKNLLSFRQPVTREYTDEQKAAASERMKNMRAAQNAARNTSVDND